MNRRTHSIRTRLAATLVAASVVLSGCMADPGPPPVIEPEPEPTTTTTQTTTPTAEPARREVVVGVEPLRNGLNPHLLSDDSSTVRSIANLVLPSVFVGGELNTQVVDSAEVLDQSPAAMTVRYHISRPAQWSDGTPITGADFVYLWQRMSTTPGVINPEPYRAIENVRVSGAGAKTVEVDFAEPVAEWGSLFQFLLPSHLLGTDASGFITGLRDDIPASAGRFLVENVDRGRGVITLNRNDRFWGPTPAAIDILTLTSVRSTTQSADQLRAGQLQFVDIVPGETTRDTYALIPEVQNRLVQSPRTLGITLSVTSPILQDPAARAELRSLIDVPLIARLGTGRSTDLLVADHTEVSTQPPVVLPQAIEAQRPLRIAADPADPTASAAVRALVDMLEQRGVAAQVVSTDTMDMVRNRLPRGDVDAILSREFNDGSRNYAASALSCPPEEAGARAGNLSGLCTPETQQRAQEILAGAVSAEQAQYELQTVRASEVTWIPLAYEQRILALAPGIVGPSPDLSVWREGLSTAGSWRLPDTTQPSQTATLLEPTPTYVEEDPQNDLESQP